VFAQNIEEPTDVVGHKPTTWLTTVKYCIDPDWMPYEAIRNNRHVGMSADYLRFVGKTAKLDFKLLRTKTWKETLDKLKSGECELISMLNRTPERDKYILYTQPYFFGPNVIVSKGDEAFLQGYENVGDRRLGAVANYRNAEYVSTYYPQINLRLFATESAGLEKLAEGEIELFIGSMLSVNSHIQKHGLRSLKISGWAEPQDKLSMGVGLGNQALLEKLDRALAQMPEALHVQIYKEWNNVRVVDELDLRYLWFVIGVFVVILSLGAWRARIVQKFNNQLMIKNEQLETLQSALVEKNRSLEALSMRDPLTSLYNRNFMHTRCNQEQQLHLRQQTPVSMIVFDIDRFKAVNDTHGHSVGDQVLIDIAKRTLDTVREIDVVARWGGEEFLILCPQTDITAANALAKRLQLAFKKDEFDIAGKITCSFGLAQFIGGETLIAWFNRADAQLYEAKSEGRDQIRSAS
jgi:diguanylate cyclase (GGDEF)-like protein